MKLARSEKQMLSLHAKYLLTCELRDLATPETVAWRVACGIKPGEEGAKKSDQPSPEEAEVVPGASEDGVEGIAVDAEQEVPPERWPSVFTWPITGSMSARQRNSRRVVGVMPRFWREWKIFLLSASTPWPR